MSRSTVIRYVMISFLTLILLVIIIQPTGAGQTRLDNDTLSQFSRDKPPMNEVTSLEEDDFISTSQKDSLQEASSKDFLSANRTIHGNGIPGENITITVRIETNQSVEGPAIDENLPSDFIIMNQSTIPNGTYRRSEKQWLWLQAAADAKLKVNYTVHIPENASVGSDYGINGTVSSANLSDTPIEGDSTLRIGTCIEQEVAGSDETISLSEIQTAINWWAESRRIPNTGGKKISLTKIQKLINIWAENTRVSC